MFVIYGIPPHDRAERRLTDRATRRLANEAIDNLKGFGYTALRIAEPVVVKTSVPAVPVVPVVLKTVTVSQPKVAEEPKKCPTTASAPTPPPSTKDGV